MSWFLKSQDYLILLIVPLMVTTIIDLRKNWSAVWDSQVTAKDREILMRCAVFLLLPIAVLLHEGGHALATVLFKGRVAEFHYGILWGYVVPEGTFSDSQMLLIYLAGNLVEVVLGFLVLATIPFVQSPPLAVLLTYFGLWTVGSTIVLYPALSLFGMYGDWIAIYTSPATKLKILIAVVHVAAIALLAFLLYGKTPRLWLLGKTNPAWKKAYSALTKRIKEQGNAEDYLSLAWLFYEAGLNSYAQHFVTKYVSISSHTAESRLLEALLLQSRGKLDQAIAILQEILTDQNTPADLIATIQAALKQCEQTSSR